MASASCCPCFFPKEEVSHEQKTRKIKVLLMGKTGAGKSAFGNLLLGREEFKSEPGLTSITGKSCIADSEDSDLCVIDTPGLSDAAEAFDNVEALKEIAKGILLVVQDGDPGVDVILFVVSAAVRFTRDEQNVLRYFEGMKNFWPHVLPVFTNIDAIETEAKPEKLISDLANDPRAPSGLQNLIEKVKGRFVVVDSTSSDSDYRDKIRKEVLDHINKLRNQNKEKRYTNDMFKKALKALKPTTDSQDPSKNTIELESMDDLCKHGEKPLVDTIASANTMLSTIYPNEKIMESSVDPNLTKLFTINPNEKIMVPSVDPNPSTESPITDQQISEDAIIHTMEDIKQRAQYLKTEVRKLK